uniref:FF domain-containing protein n=1 Tax=Timema douglasi TaxID=61478 RepID=A0A7R8VCW1_TIMDO|nr:unnamed protein product [Timema douglasi]
MTNKVPSDDAIVESEENVPTVKEPWKNQFKQLLEDTGYVTPGKLLSEVRVLFMGRECFEALTEQDCQNIYDQHQKEIVEKAKQNFQVTTLVPRIRNLHHQRGLHS